MTLEDDFQVLLAAIALSGDETSNDALLLLWVLRHVFVVDDLDAYEHVVVEDVQRGVDGLYLEPSFDPSEVRTLYVFEAKFDQAPRTYNTDVVRRLLDAVERLSHGGLRDEPSQELRLVGLRERVDEGLRLGTVRLQPVLLLAGQLKPSAKSFAAQHGVTTYDLPLLARLARAVATPGLLAGEVHVTVPRDRRFITTTGTGEVAIAEVAVAEIADWPGIDDRSLFGLNVRGELGRNRVRTELDSALSTDDDLKNFVAYHNGITVLCQEIDHESDDELVITNLSVVNGAQSVLAFQRNSATLTPDARVLVKFVRVGTSSPEFATEVARRSNTQTAVNPRNLRANDGRQRALEVQFADDFPDYTYVVKPDISRVPLGTAINNDEAAQLLCAVYNERPWLAVKRLELFRPPNYQLIFSPAITASHIVLAHRIRERVQANRESFPEDYRRSWRLTAVMACFLVGQVLRARPDLTQWLESPDAAARGGAETDEELDNAVALVAKVMAEWHEQRTEEFGFDDYKVDFKRENVAQSLGKLIARAASVSA